MQTMTLPEYCAAFGHGTASSLAHDLGVTPQTMAKWVSGDKPVPETRCQAIERATGGLVPVEKLRKDLTWVRVREPRWRFHPEGKPLIDHLPTY